MTVRQDREEDATPVSARLDLFLGDARKYVHGADLFDTLTEATGTDGLARLRLQRLSDNALDLRFDMPQLDHPDFCGLFEFTRGGVRRMAWLQERDEKVSRRSGLMDHEAIEAADFGADGAEIARNPRFSVGKSGLILLVALLERLFPDDAWNLAELEAQRPRAEGTTVRVRLMRHIGKFLFASIESDNQPWGRLTLASTPYVEVST